MFSLNASRIQTTGCLSKVYHCIPNMRNINLISLYNYICNSVILCDVPWYFVTDSSWNYRRLRLMLGALAFRKIERATDRRTLQIWHLRLHFYVWAKTFPRTRILVRRICIFYYLKTEPTCVRRLYHDYDIWPF